MPADPDAFASRGRRPILDCQDIVGIVVHRFLMTGVLFFGLARRGYGGLL
ncbi:MAG: hypothetical protein ACREV1_16830 [Gammaproteobacteria bacterium]